MKGLRKFRLFLATKKSKTIWFGRFAKTLKFPYHLIFNKRFNPWLPSFRVLNTCLRCRFGRQATSTFVALRWTSLYQLVYAINSSRIRVRYIYQLSPSAFADLSTGAFAKVEASADKQQFNIFVTWQFYPDLSMTFL